MNEGFGHAVIWEVEGDLAHTSLKNYEEQFPL